MELFAGVAKDDTKENVYHVSIMDNEDNFQGTMIISNKLLDILQNNIPNIRWLQDNKISIDIETKLIK